MPTVLFVVWMGTMAFIISLCTLYVDFLTSSSRDIETSVGVIGGLASGLLWFVTAFETLGMFHIGDSGTTTLIEATGAALLFTAFGVFMIVIAWKGTIKAFNVMDIMQEEEGAIR